MSLSCGVCLTFARQSLHMATPSRAEMPFATSVTGWTARLFDGGTRTIASGAKRHTRLTKSAAVSARSSAFACLSTLLYLSSYKSCPTGGRVVSNCMGPHWFGPVGTLPSVCQSSANPLAHGPLRVLGLVATMAIAGCQGFYHPAQAKLGRTTSESGYNR